MTGSASASELGASKTRAMRKLTKTISPPSALSLVRHRILVPTGMLSTVLTAAVAVQAADWSQYRGPNQDGSSPEKVARWPASGPRTLWKTPLTDGFSSFAASQGRAVTLVERVVDGAPREVCVALDASSGKELWATPLGVAKYDKGGDTGAPDNDGGDGPRSTPTVNGQSVYVLDERLNLECLSLKNGQPVWTRELVKEHAGRLISWQNAASPLVDGDLVFVAGGGPGQALLGIDKNDGHVVWKGQDDKMTHSTPVAATIHGTRQIIFYTQVGLVALAPKTGDVLWRYNFKYNVSSAISPVVSGDIVYCSAGYGTGSGAAKITEAGGQFTATEIWRVTGMKLCNHWSTPVCQNGYLYGMYSFKEFAKGPLKCVELATGKEMWSRPGFGQGNCILAGDQLVALSDSGEVVVIQPNPQAYTEVARVHALAGKCWSTPVISDGHLFVRSTKEGACFDVSGKMARR